ncbi:MAG: YbaK/EbsC family protein [Desulfotomaculaceae bacterium]|nr:YbaK/EbsC family protein [Desulfotomaculaceae bacterium]
MNNYEQKLSIFMTQHNIKGEHMTFEKSCHSVQEASEAANASPKDFVKNICMLDDDGNLIVAIVKGEDRVSSSKVAKTLNISPPRTATVDEILQKTGFPCGGVPSFGYKATFLIDLKVMDKNLVYTGGGSEFSLVKIDPIELHKANSAHIVKIRK